MYKINIFLVLLNVLLLPCNTTNISYFYDYYPQNGERETRMDTRQWQLYFLWSVVETPWYWSSPLLGVGGWIWGAGGFEGRGPQTSENSTPDYCNHFGIIRIFRWQFYDWRIVKIHRVAKCLKNSWQRPWPEPLKLDRTLTLPLNPWELSTTHVNVETHAVALRHNFFA